MHKLPLPIEAQPSNTPCRIEGGCRTRGNATLTSHSKPLLTVITVVHNGREHIEPTIQNVLSQTYEPIEYLIIDGGSTDGTIDIIRKYEDKIDYWLSEKDKGIYDAMNKGWKLASTASTILYLGAGDIIIQLPQIIELDKIIYGIVTIGKNIRFIPRYNWRIRLGNTLHHQALLIPKRYSISPPFNTQYTLYADFDFNLRLYKQKHNARFDDQFFVYALPDGVSAKLDSHQIRLVVLRNYGRIWSLISCLSMHYSKFKHRVLNKKY
jgi:glycosyltransferase involved in cell wall biosynthesis